MTSVAAKGCHSVQQLGASDTHTAVTGDVVILAVSYPAISDVIAQRGDVRQPAPVRNWASSTPGSSSVTAISRNHAARSPSSNHWGLLDPAVTSSEYVDRYSH